MADWFFKWLPKWLRIRFDYAGSRDEILRVLSETPASINLMDIAEVSPRFGFKHHARLQGHIKRMVKDKLIREIETPRDIIRRRPEGGRAPLRYEITTSGKMKLTRQNPAPIDL